MLATLGGLLKDLRIQRDIPQTELAYALGWKEASRISRIEQGKVEKPDIELLESIMNALKLNEEERHMLYYVGNYLPSQKDIDATIEKIKPIIEEWPYPASCRDYTWRILHSNNILYEVLSISEKERTERERNYPRILQVIFDHESSFRNNNLSEMSQEEADFFKRVLLHFQYKQRERINERWYQDLLRQMMDNDLFRKIWKEVQQDAGSATEVARIGNKPNLHNIYTEGQKLRMYFFVTPVFKDPRFEIEFYIPADNETYKYFNKKEGKI